MRVLMDQYFVKTMIAAVMKLGPIVLFALGGYLLFIKLPFLFLKKSMQDQKQKLQEENKGLSLVQEKTVASATPVKKPQEKPLRQELPPPQAKQEKKQEQKRTEEKKEQPKRPEAKPSLSDEEILGFKPGQSFTQSELKKRYVELIRQNHPDKVATRGPDFKKLAEKNTKEINQAFEKLKKKAS